MSQPEWKYIGTIGDRDPIAHGGGFVYKDLTGVYPPEVVYFEPGSDEDWHKTEGATPLQAYRFCLDPPRFKTFTAEGKREYDTAGLKDPSKRDVTWTWYREWFARPDKIQSVASASDITPCRLLRCLCSKDPMTRAWGYEALIAEFGTYEFDQYPVTMTEDEAYAKYADEMESSLGRTA